MQTPPTSSNSSTLVYALLLLATPITSVLSALITYLLTKSRQKTDIQKSRAEAGKLEAENRQIDAEIILESCQRIREMNDIIHDKDAKEIEDAREIARLEWELSLAAQREKLHNQQMDQAHAELLALREPRKPA